MTKYSGMSVTARLAFFLLFFFSIVVVAAPAQKNNAKSILNQNYSSVQNVNELLIQMGIGGGRYKTNPGNQNFRITPIQTDYLTKASQKSDLFSTFAFHYLHHLAKNQWLSAISIGPTIYYQPSSFHGEVYEFKMPNLNNLTYEYKVHPLNVYVEADVYLHSLIQDHVVPFIFAGGGISVIKQRYQETVSPKAVMLGIPARIAISTNSSSDTVSAYELGAGILVNLPHNLFVAGRYVYQHTNSAKLFVPTTSSSLKYRSRSNSGYFVFGYRAS